MKRIILLLVTVLAIGSLHADDGYRLWLRYDKISDAGLLQQYQKQFKRILFLQTSPTLEVARNELNLGLKGLLGTGLPFTEEIREGTVIVSGASKGGNPIGYVHATDLDALGDEGFLVRSISTGNKNITLILGKTDIGALYGVFHFLRLMQMHQPMNALNITSVPKIKNRILDHWDNLNRTVERGYAGFSIWNWHTLPGYIDQRYIDYARANASIGINGTVLTNVNANALTLTKEYLVKVKALADVFRPYGIKVYLTARFSAPIEIGRLKTADPLDTSVQNWWKAKATEIYQYIPDFGGFLVKANSEGQPGPQNYGRTHADGANMLADAVAPFGGLVMWRAFVYDVRVQKAEENFDTNRIDAGAPSIASSDRFQQAYNEFKPLDGKFRRNVLVQVKNGPIDFQPREPFSPLFGSMPQTPLMMEFQLTQEYLGQGTHLVYEAPLFKEVLDADTWRGGKDSRVSKIIDGSLQHYSITGMAGVANIGNDRNWTGHPFGQANWYAFGRLAWDHELSSEQIADEWLRQSFGSDPDFLRLSKNIMMASREALVNYMTPLGLHHIMATGHHYGPGPWVDNLGRADWNPVYYHKADAAGIGFDRTSKGSNALVQYAPEVRAQFEDMSKCPEEYLLWFHHVPWNYRLRSGRTLWDELCYRYDAGVKEARRFRQEWEQARGKIDEERYRQVAMLLDIQANEAAWWRNACLLYFQGFSKQAFPSGIEQPEGKLDDYKKLRFPFAPGNG